MNGLRVFGIAIVIAGAASLLYGGFSYTRENTALKVGPVELKVEEKKTVNIPIWAGVAAVVAGAMMLVVSARKP